MTSYISPARRSNPSGKDRSNSAAQVGGRTAAPVITGWAFGKFANAARYSSSEIKRKKTGRELHWYFPIVVEHRPQGHHVSFCGFGFFPPCV